MHEQHPMQDPPTSTVGLERARDASDGIARLDLHIATYLALGQHAGLVTVDDVDRLSDDGLRRIPHMTADRLAEVRRAVSDFRARQ